MDKTYTLGQMIDILIKNPDKRAYIKNSDVYMKFDVNGILCWYGLKHGDVVSCLVCINYDDYEFTIK